MTLNAGKRDGKTALKAGTRRRDRPLLTFARWLRASRGHGQAVMWHAERMSGWLLLTQRRDGKTYPSRNMLPEPERGRAMRLVHICRANGLSYRAIVRELASEGLHVSTGTVWTWIHSTSCELCDNGAPGVTQITILDGGGA